MLISALNTTLEDQEIHDPAETNLVLEEWVQLSTWLITCKCGLAKTNRRLKLDNNKTKNMK